MMANWFTGLAVGFSFTVVVALLRVLANRKESVGARIVTYALLNLNATCLVMGLKELFK